MSRKRRIRDEILEDEEGEEVVRRRDPRWRLRFVLVLLFVIGLVATAPTIIGKTPLRNYLLSLAVPPEAGRLQCGDANFSWFGSQTLAGVSFTDADGQPVVSADAVTLERSIVALAANRRDLGKLLLVRPVVNVVVEPQGTNLERIASRLALRTEQAANAGQDAAASIPVVIELEVVDGVLTARDVKSGGQWRVDQLSATLRPSTTAPGWEATGTGVLGAADLAAAQQTNPGGGAAAAPSAAGRFKFQLHPAADGAQQLELVADRLPLAPLEPLIARSVPGGRLAGFVSPDLHAQLTKSATGAPQIALAGKLDLSEFRFTASALNGDLVDLPAASAVIDATLEGSRLRSKQLDAKASGFDSSFAGDLDLAELAGLDPKNLPKRDATFSAHVELARLAAMLPRTLRLRPGVRIDSGSLEVSAKTAADDQGTRRWTVAAVAENLVGADGGKPIRWTQPVEAGFDLADAPAGPRLERLLIRSPFASVATEAEVDGFSGTVKFNLGQLGREAGQFVDLSAWQLAGAGEGEFRFKPDGEKFTATADLDIAGVDVRRGGKPVWVDEKLRLELAASGVRDGIFPQRIDAAKLTARAPSDATSIELTAPVAPGLADQIWAFRIEGAGPLASWAGRLRPWMTGVPETLAGQATVTAQLRARSGYVEVADSKVSVDAFQMQLGQIRVAEQRIEAQGDFRWDAATSAVESQNLTLSSTTLAARARGVSVRTDPTGATTARGDVAFRTDLARLAAWGLWTPAAGGVEPRGQAVGRVQLATEGPRASGKMTATVDQFQLIRSGVPAMPGANSDVAWSEPHLELAADAAYDQSTDSLQLSSVSVRGQTIQLAGAAAIDQLRTAGVVRGELNINYDAGQLAQLLTTYLGPGVRLEGANSARIAANGRLNAGLPAIPVSAPGSAGGFPSVVGLPPDRSRSEQPPGGAGGYHWSRTWQATSEAGWSAANIYGLPVGPAKLVGNLREGQLDFNPLDLAVGQGRLSLHPRVVLDPAPMRLQLAGGQVASNVEISAETSQMMLKYAAPILAGATRTEGAFSAYLDNFEMPLGETQKMRSAGRLTIHRLSITPGPMIADVVNLVSQVESLSKGQPLGALGAAKPIRGVTMTEKTIDVQVVDGRVYHRNLEFMIDDVPVRSYGSVGLDETLALMIEVPIQQKWLGREKAFQALAGQTIQIPVGGTFSRPQVDQRAVANLSAQLVQGAATGVIGSELNKALDKLFKPRQ